MSEARYQSTADLLDPWRDDVLSGKPPTLYPVGTGELARIDIGPGLVTLIGGAPGAGKTALTLQWVLDALSATPSLKALILNVEMSPSTLLDRQLARLAGIDGSLIRHRRLTAEHADTIERGMEALERIADRLAFVRPPFDLANVALTADAFDAGLISDRLHSTGACSRRARRPPRGRRCDDGLSSAIRRRRDGNHRRRRPRSLEGREGAVELQRGAEPGELPRNQRA